MRSSVALAIVLLTARLAQADDVATIDGIIEGIVIDAVLQPIGGATVRVVGDAFVVTLHADGRGAVRVSGLPPGRYRIEVERGSLRAPYPVTSKKAEVLERDYIRSCIGAMYRRRFEPVPAPPRVIDGRSTALGIRLGRREIQGAGTARGL